MFSQRVITHVATAHNTLANAIKPNRLLCRGWCWMEEYCEWNLRGGGRCTWRWKRRRGGVKEKIDKAAASSWMTTQEMDFAGCCIIARTPSTRISAHSLQMGRYALHPPAFADGYKNPSHQRSNIFALLHWFLHSCLELLVFSPFNQLNTLHSVA